MTVTLAYSDKANKTAWIAADSCASDSVNHSIVKNQKVFHPVGRTDVLIGFAGSFRLANLLQYIPDIFPSEDELSTDEIDMAYLINEFTPIINALTEDFDDDELWELLIAVGDRIYRMQMDLSIIEPSDNSDAIGIGGPVALGAFKILNQLTFQSIENQMKQALQIACDSCHGCAPPFLVMKTGYVKSKSNNNKKEREKRGYSIIRNANNDNNDDTLIIEDVSNDDKPDKPVKSNKDNKKKKKDKDNKKKKKY